MKKFIKTYFVGIILACVFSMGTYLAWITTPTTDETIHVASAYLVFTRHEHRFDPEHPYLFKYLTALPVLVMRPNLPPDDAKLWENGKGTLYDSWHEAREWSDQWLYKSGNNPQLLIFLARMPGVLCLVLLSYLVYRFAKVWYSEKVARYSLIGVAFTPTILAHGQLANTDVPVSLAFMVGLWCLWRYQQQPGRSTAAWVGLALGAALITKFSAITLVVIAGLWWLLVNWSARRWKAAFTELLIVFVIIWLIIWIGYLGQSPLQFTDEPRTTWLIGEINNRLQIFHTDVGSVVSALRYILPSAFIKGMVLIYGSAALGRPSYILGTVHSVGVWYYFPLLFLFKTQVVALVLGGLYVLRRIKDHGLRITTPATRLLVIAAAVYMVISMTNKLNLGIRHILPVLVIAAFLWGNALAYVEAKRTDWKWLVPSLLVLYIVPVLWQFPHMLGYRNAFVQPTNAAYRYFNDSNLEWGGQVKEIKKAIDENFPGEVIYSDFPWNPYALDFYGINRKPFNERKSGGIIMLTGTQLAHKEWRMYWDETPLLNLDGHTLFFRVP